MDELVFWSLIEETRKAANNDTETQGLILFERLASLPPDEIFEFYKVFMEMLWRSFRADLWDVAQIIACGCSEDVFHDFRAWLISQGKTVFESAMNDPETVANLVPIDDREEALNGLLPCIILIAYEHKAGHDVPEVGYFKPLVLIGEFEKEENFPHKYPNTFSKFGDCSDFP